MTALLDTHVLFWWLTGNAHLSATAAAYIGDSGTTVLVSAVSGWEIALKYKLGKLPIPDDPASFLPREIRNYRFQSLDLNLEQALMAASLPLHHKDPFDRLLVAQAQSLSVPIFTADAAISQYDVRTIW